MAFRQKDVERALRAAQAVGASHVVVQTDGSLLIGVTGLPGITDRHVTTRGPEGRYTNPEDIVL